MKRTTLQPLRTRRVVAAATASSPADLEKLSRLTAKTRRTLAAVSSMWLSFSTTVRAGSPAEAVAPTTRAPWSYV